MPLQPTIQTGLPPSIQQQQQQQYGMPHNVDIGSDIADIYADADVDLDADAPTESPNGENNDKASFVSAMSVAGGHESPIVPDIIHSSCREGGGRGNPVSATGDTNVIEETQVDASLTSPVPSLIASSEASSAVSSMDISTLTFSGASDDHLPRATGDATMVLHERYNRPPYHIQSLKNRFVSWNTGPPNALKWAAAFVCPITGESFVSGKLLFNPPAYCDGPGKSWYSKKRMAEKAASGMAVDCFRYREDSAPNGIFRFCLENPFLEPAEPHRLYSIPKHVSGEQRLQIKKLQDKLTTAATPCRMNN